MDVGIRTRDTAHVFHINKTLYADKYLDERLKSGRITADDASLLQSYIAERKATRHLSVGRVNKIYFTLLRWRDFVPPFRENTIHDVYKGIEGLGNALNKKGSPRFARNTISDTVATVKTFYLWMIEEGYSTIPEKKMQQIKRPPQDAVTKTAEDLITADEIEHMVTACTWTRDRALLLTLYEGGMRIGEIGALTWGDVKFDEKGVVITVKSQKTEKARYLRLVMAREHLARWKADYPGDPRADARCSSRPGGNRSPIAR